MYQNNALATDEVSAIFAEEITAASGTVSDTIHDKKLLFARSVLRSKNREVRPGDWLQAGVALRASERDVRVHPYIFRLVCTNGAIREYAPQSYHIHVEDRLEAFRKIREAIRACCGEDACTEGLQEIQGAQHIRLDRIERTVLLRWLQQHFGKRMAAMMLERLSAEGDPTRYALMNAVTSVARDTHDPVLRWRLEIAGAEIGAGRGPSLNIEQDARNMRAERTSILELR